MTGSAWFRGQAAKLAALLLILASAQAWGAGTTAACPARVFREVTEEAGIHFVHHKPIFDPRLEKIMSWMGSINAGVAVADYDWDGDPDIYLLSSLAGYPNALYRNEGSFRFTEVGR